MTPAAPVTMRRITALWWPLAMSWLMMGVELPLVTAVAARLPDHEPNLAALASLVYPLALLVEAPIIMLLAASTALVVDRASYQKLWRFTHGAGLLLTVLHIAIAFTPAYDWIARGVINVDETVVEPGRVGLQLMTPWTWAIASRRFQQGVLIRFERSRAVVAGTLVRLITVSAVLVAGYLSGTLSGIAVASSAIATGVLAEAFYASWRTRPLLRSHLRTAESPGDPAAKPLDWASFARFYAPLAVTPLMTLILQPMGAAAMNRMPEKMASTATWSAVYGLVFLFRTAGFAFNEVVVTLVAQPDGPRQLRRAAWGMGGAMTAVLLLFAATPLGPFWFGRLTGLPPELTEVAVGAVAFAVLMPAYAVLQSFYQGALVQARATRAVTEAVLLYLVVSSAALGVGIWMGSMRGIVFVLCAFTGAGILQTLWLRYRAAPVLSKLASQHCS